MRRRSIIAAMAAVFVSKLLIAQQPAGEDSAGRHLKSRRQRQGRELGSVQSGTA